MQTLVLRLVPLPAELSLAELLARLVADPALLRAAEILRSGGLVAFPTETVYGLGANALSAAAVESIFKAKQRPHWDPVIVHAPSAAEARKLASEWPEEAEKLAAAFWPGPLTMLLPRNVCIPAVCTAGREKVGLRVPSHPVAQALLLASGVPVAAPSANRFGHTSPTTAEHVLADLDGRIDAILDAGPSAVGVESTVLDPTTHPPIIYRPGGVTAEQLRALLGEVAVAERVVSDQAPPESLESPGLGIRHYAPRARLQLVEGVEGLSQAVEQAGCRVGVLLPSGWPLSRANARVTVQPWGDWSEPESLARELYSGLRALDELGVELILCPLPPAEGIGLALRDRLHKAAK
jgi:L-threonylcarbamoyladenylate synthase